METESPDPNYQGTYSAFTIRQDSQDPIVLQVWINEVPVDMELDTGAASSLISAETYQKIQQSSLIPSCADTVADLGVLHGFG